MNPVPPLSHPAAPPLARQPFEPVRRGHPAPGRGWAWAGVAAGVLGPVGLLGTVGIYTQEAWEAGDNESMAASVADSTTLVWIHQALGAVLAALLIVFALGLRRRLAASGPRHALVPDVAAAGVLLTAVAVFLGAGMDTELWWAVQPGSAEDPDTVGALATWYGTTPWLWGGLGLSAAAVAFGGLAHGSSGRAVAWVSAALAAVLAATQAGPAQYIALLPGALWLLVVGLAFARRGDAVDRAG